MNPLAPPPSPPGPAAGAPRTGNDPSLPRSAYFVGPVTDFLAVGGAALMVFALFLALPRLATAPAVGWLVAVGLWVCNYPHFASTNYRLYSSRTSRRAYPATAWLTPALLLAAVVACFLRPATAADLVLIYFLWSPYHYSAQAMGVAMVYSRRRGLDLTRTERRVLAGLSQVSFVTATAHIQADRHTYHYFGVAYTGLGIPGLVPRLLDVVLWASLLAVAAVIARRALTGRRMIPFIVLLPLITQFLWSTAATPGYYAVIIPFFHCLQYLFIAWNYQLAVAAAAPDRRRSTRFAVTETARWAALNAALGFALFWCLPYAGHVLGRSLAFSTAVILAAVQIHHFFVDGVIWKLRAPSTRQPLMSTLSDVAGRAPRARPSGRALAALAAGASVDPDL